MKTDDWASYKKQGDQSGWSMFKMVMQGPNNPNSMTNMTMSEMGDSSKGMETALKLKKEAGFTDYQLNAECEFDFGKGLSELD